MLLTRSFLAFGCLFLLLPSCAKKKEASPSSSSVYTIPTENLSDAQELAKNAEVSCAPGAYCSPSVGLLGISSEDGAGQCTASLIAEDLIATNSHCIPEDLKAAGSGCNNRLWMHFARNSARPDFETRIACEKIIYASPEDGSASSPDYAYVKLASPSKRPTLRFSRQGFADNETVTVHKVNPVRRNGQMRGSHTTASCKAVFGSMITEKFFHSMAEVALLADCEVVKGNSGGPVTASDGTIRGVIFAFLDTPEIQRRVNRNPNIRIRGSLTKLNLASNFACLRDPWNPGQLPPACNGVEAMEEARREERATLLADSIRTQFERELEADAQPLFRDFLWGPKLQQERTETRILPEPACVKRGAVSRLLNRTVNFRRPEWVLQQEFDRYGRGTYHLKKEGAAPHKLTLVQSGGGYQASIFGSGSHETPEVPLCQ